MGLMHAPALPAISWLKCSLVGVCHSLDVCIGASPIDFFKLQGFSTDVQTLIMLLCNTYCPQLRLPQTPSACACCPLLAI